MPEIPTPPSDTPPWADVDNARLENRQWADESSLRGQKANNELWALKAVGVATFFLILFFALIFVVSLGAWIYHHVMPCKWFWLSPDQLSKIQSVIFSGAIGAVVSGYAQKHMK